MHRCHTRTILIPIMSVCCAGLFACTAGRDDPAIHVTADASVKTGPVYVSRKQVSTDCGIEFTPPPPPGFAHRPGEDIAPMTPGVAKPMAVGAGRPLAQTDYDRVSPGYVLIEPGYVKPAFLVNNDKEVVATFENDYFGYTQLLDDGSRLASSNMFSEVFVDGGGYRGCVEEYGPDGSLNWRLRLATDQYVHHHDVYKLDNGNVLAIVWEREPVEHAIALGRDPEHVAENGNIWYDGVIEVNPQTAEIVWEWSLRHHIIQDFDPGKPDYGVIADHPERFDINAIEFNRDGSTPDDWTHVNSIDYNPEFDQILLSTNHLSEIWVIDHSTTPYESQGHTGGRWGKGGDILYRWGRPALYDRGTEEDRRLFNQHDAEWIDAGLPGAGNILVFNNGDRELRPYTTVVEIVPDVAADGSYVLGENGRYGAAEPVWEYVPNEGEEFFSFFISGAQRLANGNTLVNQGAGAKVREVTPAGDIVWEYAYADESDPPQMLFRANRYPADHPAIQAIIGQNKQ